MVTLLYSAAKYPNRLDALIDQLMMVPSASTTCLIVVVAGMVAAAVFLARRHSSLANSFWCQLQKLETLRHIRDDARLIPGRSGASATSSVESFIHRSPQRHRHPDAL